MTLITIKPNFTVLLIYLLGFSSVLVLPSSNLANSPGTQYRTMQSGKKERDYLLHIPPVYQKNSTESLALVIMLHGRSGNGQRASSRYYGWTELADKEQFIVVFPTALGSPTSWQIGWRGKPSQDSQFLSELIDLLLNELRINADQVFMTGHSSGGFMSFSYAVTHSLKVAAIAQVAGLLINTKQPTRPISVISFHGMADDVVPYSKKDISGKGWLTALESAKFFVRHNNCGEPIRSDLNGGKVHLDTWSGGQNSTEVQLYSIENGDHGWPRKSYHSVSATEIIWNFFKAHPRESSN